MKTSITWLPAFADPAFPSRELHIWLTRLDEPEEYVKAMAALLSGEEIARAEKFVFARDRQHFIVARGTLRTLLGLYLHQSPAGIALCKGPNGKPQLCAGAAELPLKFNLSHSNGLALYVFARQQEVGIDLEKIQPDFAATDVAERFFSVREQKELRALPAELRAEGFFHCWTRKEAYLKARGDGLQTPLAGFDVTLTPDQPAKLNSTDSERWTLNSFIPAPDFVAATVAEGGGWNMKFLDATVLNLIAASKEASC